MEMESIKRPLSPTAPIRPTRLETHGDARVDDYFWLREREDPATIDYLEAENDYAKEVMAHTQPLQETLFQELKTRIQETDQTVPVQIDDFLYYQRTESGQQYPIYCRRATTPPGAEVAEEEVLLDLNQEAEGEIYLRLANYAVSPNHRYLAYALDTNGSESYTLRVKNLVTGALLPDRISDTYYGVAWANDNQRIFYVTFDLTHRPDKVWRHTLGTQPEADVLIYQETDDLYFLGLRKSRSQRLLLVHLKSKTTSEVRFLDLDQPQEDLHLLQPRVNGVEYVAEHHTDQFFILTNDQAQNFRIMRAPMQNPGRNQWQELIPHDPAIKRDRLSAFAGHLVIYERENGLRHIRIRDLASGLEHRMAFPEPVYTITSGENPNFHTTTLRYGYTSLVTPESVYDYQMTDHTQILRKQEQVHGYDPEAYTSRRVWVTAEDGSQIPISLVHGKGIVLDGNNPLLLYGYGSYGISIDPAFQSNRVSLLDRGVIYAIAHIRGGGEMGRPWYESGKFLHKKNTFTDFIDAAEHLIKLGYTRPQQLAMMGRSAGGLLMGAVLNMRPDLFAAAVAGVPFVDVISTMLDPTIPLTVVEYEEWGNPADPIYYAYMKSYSPYDNLKEQAYPHILVTAGLNDPRVQYWEPAKWVAKLRAVKQDQNRLLLKTNMGAGHGGPSGRYGYLREVAFEYAFLLDCLGLAGERDQQS